MVSYTWTVLRTNLTASIHFSFTEVMLA